MTCCNLTNNIKFDYDFKLCNACFNLTYKRCVCCDTLYNYPMLYFPKKRNKCIECTRTKQVIVVQNKDPYCIFCKKTEKKASFDYSNIICNEHANEKWRICPRCASQVKYNYFFKNDSRCKKCSRERARENAKLNGEEYFTYESDEE